MDTVVARAIRVTAQENNVPEEALLALFKAESNLDPRAERWYVWTERAKALIAVSDWSGLQGLVTDITLPRSAAGAGSDDMSFGLDQASWRWSPEFEQVKAAVWPKMTFDELRSDVHLILEFRDQSFDPWYAARRGAKRLAPLYEKYGLPECLYRYNKPDGSASQKARTNYDRALKWARENPIVIEESEPVAQEVQEFSFETEGFGNKAAELGESVVGQPLEAEHRLGKSAYVVQFTTTGVMLYNEDLNETYFFAAAHP